jgi:hypothetical protein
VGWREERAKVAYMSRPDTNPIPEIQPPYPYTLRLVPIHAGECKGRLVQNPNYGRELEPMTGYSIAGWQPVPSTVRQLEPFFSALRASIEEEGVKSPVCAWNLESGLYMKTGMSRMLISGNLNIPCPTIVSDWTGKYDDYPEIKEPLKLLHTTPGEHYYGTFGWVYRLLDDREEYGPI